MSYKFNMEDGEIILDILNDKKKRELEEVKEELGEDAMVAACRYMGVRSLFESSMMAMIGEYEDCKGEDKSDAITHIGLTAHYIAKQAAKLAMEMVLDMDSEDMEDTISVIDNEESEGLAVDELPEQMAKELSEATGMSIEEMRESGLRIKVASESSDGTMEMMSDEDSKKVVSELSLGDYKRKYVGVRKNGKIESVHEHKPKEEPKSMDEIISEFEAAREEL